MARSSKNSRTFGFTLIEIMMVVALLAALAVFSTPFYISFLRRNDLSLAARALSLAAQNAEIHAQGILLDQTWSVHVAPGTITMYLGSNFATRDQAWDIVTEMNPTLTLSGSSDMNFSRGTGFPTAPYSIIITNLNKETRTVSINAKGVVNIQ